MEPYSADDIQRRKRKNPFFKDTSKEDAIKWFKAFCSPLKEEEFGILRRRPTIVKEIEENLDELW